MAMARYAEPAAPPAVLVFLVRFTIIVTLLTIFATVIP